MGTTSRPLVGLSALLLHVLCFQQHLLNEFEMMWALRDKFPLHYIVFKQTASHIPHEVCAPPYTLYMFCVLSELCLALLLLLAAPT